MVLKKIKIKKKSIVIVLLQNVTNQVPKLIHQFDLLCFHVQSCLYVKVSISYIHTVTRLVYILYLINLLQMCSNTANGLYPLNKLMSQHPNTWVTGLCFSSPPSQKNPISPRFIFSCHPCLCEFPPVSTPYSIQGNNRKQP